MPESHVLLQPRQQERRRARELYQYFNPSDIEFAQLSFTSPEPPSQKPRNVDSSLAAFCHLVAIRLNMKRALVSLIGDGTQYSIAESTRTLSLGNEDQFEDEGDGLWISCSSYPQGGLLCERTVALPPSKGSYSCFTVQDLSTDNRFKHLPFVAEHPHYRFYVGTPLTTKQGINIGSLCLLDNKVHDDLTASQLDFLGTMAATCMNHLEMKREAYEGRMIKKMRNGLRCFVEGRSWYAEDNDTEPGLTKELETSPKIQRVDHTFSPKVDERKNFNSAFQNTNKPSSPLASAPEVLLGQTSLQEQPEPITDRQLLFGRAANLLRESLGLDKTGCVTFLDTERQLVYSPSDNVGGTVASTRNNSSEGRRFSLPSIVSSTRNMHKTSPKHLPATILAFSTADHPLSSSCISNMPFLPVPENIVEDLCKRYPRGRIWHFDESGNASSEDDQIYKTLDGEHDTGVSLRTNKIHSKDMEAKTLQRYLPSVRQLAFMPMWDSASSKWYCGAFIWSSDETRVFTLDRELDFLGAFSKSVMVEVSRLAAILSDEQKGDFIGSISHELRSPLHGILASVDFFSDTHLSTFQQSLVDQIDSCGRTLLDTINHVLDFSKINAFERGWKNKVHKKTGKGVPSDRNLSQGLPSALSIYAVTNVAGICEEVIEGVAAGHLFQELTSSVGKFQVFSGIPEAGLQSNKNVDMVLSIEPGDWVFVTQPGALRRVIMNLFGNSLKYTNKGSVMVHLQQTDTKKMVEGQETQKQIILTITDTGKGISEQYLRTKLFTPFSQENSLAPGTGLGLSLVKSIVNMLDGKIDICSRVDEGTEVQICIPLHRPLPGSDTPASTPDSSQTNRSEDLIGRLPSVISGKSITFYRDGSPAGGISNMASSSKTVFRYITTWFNTVVLDWGTVIRPDIIFVEETDLDDLVRLCKAQDARNTPAIIVLCHQARRHNSVYEKKYDGVVEYLSKPFGPIKLAKALIFCLEGIAARNDGIVPLANEDGSYAIENPTSATPLVNEITLDPAADLPPIIVEADRVVVAREGPLNEQQALDTTAGYLNAKTDTNGTEDFPFPNSDALKEPSASIIKVDHYTNGVDELMLRPSDKRLMESQPDRLPFSRGVTPIALQHLGGLSSNTREQIPQRLSPRILLVDDNRINLRLLQTLMRKRKYTMVDSAENGLEAVKAAENNPLGYDIILMDLSMPILNGFEATSRIRDLEAVRAAEASPLDTFKPALIIALTGLASNRDRNEAFQAGVDLYMTKPETESFNMINLNPGSKASVYLSRPPSHLFRFPPPPDPATLAPPTMPFDWLHPFNIPSAIYNIPLSVVYPLTIALVYITSVNIFNSVNNRRGRKPWGISRTKAFDYFVIAHNVFLALYSGWTCVGMYQGLRASVPTWYQRDGFAGMVDGFCKIHGPRGLGNAVTYNPETTSWGFTNSMIKLDGNNLPDSTDLGRMWNEGLAYYGWLFYLSKFYEVLDTVIILLKGKQSSTLQTYHHAGAMMCMWAGISYMAPPIWMFVVVNSFIHGIMYSYYAICALGYHVPTVIKRTITTLQITQFVAGVSFAVTHLFIKYDIPVMVPYLFTKDNLSSAIPSAASTVSSVVSSVVASATASADMGTWLKKVGLRAAGQEGLAANIRNSEGQQFGIDAVHAMQDSKAREEIRYRLDYQAINCLDTAGEGFAVWFNICYLFPLTYLFGKFFVQSYLKRTQSSTRRHASSSGIGAAEKAGSDVFRDTKTQYQERPVHGYSKTNSVFATPTSEKAEIKGVEKPAPEPEVSSKSGLQMESFPSYSEVVIVGTEAEADKTKTEDEKEAEARMQQSSY